LQMVINNNSRLLENNLFYIKSANLLVRFNMLHKRIFID
jgi:hypothetical protein